MPTLQARYAVVSESEFPLELDDLVYIVCVAFINTYPQSLAEQYVPIIGPGDSIFELVSFQLLNCLTSFLSFRFFPEANSPDKATFQLQSMLEIQRYRGAFLEIALTVVKKFFNESYYDRDGRLKYCFETPEAIHAYARSVLSPSGVHGTFHWEYNRSSHVRLFNSSSPICLI